MPDIAVYPGSFDPITNGHLDLIQRALKIFDRIIVAVATNAFKKSLFTIEERMEMCRVSLADYPMVSIDTFDGLLVKYATRKKPGPSCGGSGPSRISSMNFSWP